MQIRYPAVLLDALTHVPKVTMQMTQDYEVMQQWSQQLQLQLDHFGSDLSPQIELVDIHAKAPIEPAAHSQSAQSEIQGDAIQSNTELFTDQITSEPVEIEEHTPQWLPRITVYVHQLAHHYLLDAGFINSSEYARLLRLSAQWNTLLTDTAFIRRETGGSVKDLLLKDFDHLWQQVMLDARRGLGVQRYKGLGEMNPDQLWDTTMDPENRRMLRVTIEDAIAADHLFTCLMGDHVEPRRAFIEEHALTVTNLDI